jgi:hypothetical protein
MLLLVIALAHGTLSNIKSPDNLTQYDLREGPTTEVPLHWETDALNKPVFRNVTARGPQEIPLNKKRFYYSFCLILITADYSRNITIHDIH